jgi:hypothetical protein
MYYKMNDHIFTPIIMNFERLYKTKVLNKTIHILLLMILFILLFFNAGTIK